MAALPPWLATIGTALRHYSEGITRDPLPEPWVDLIHRLNEEQRLQSRQQAPAPHNYSASTVVPITSQPSTGSD